MANRTHSGDPDHAPIKYVPMSEEARLALESVEELRLRMIDWLERERKGEVGQLAFDAAEVRRLLHAVQVAAWVPSAALLSERLSDGVAKYRRTKNPRAVLQAIGVTTGKRGAHYPLRAVTDEYLTLIGMPRSAPPLHWIKPLIRCRPGYPQPPISQADAIRYLTGVFEFKNSDACRTWLVRARKRLGISFPIPNTSKL